MNQRSIRRHGLSLVELFVVIGVIGLLFALLVPAVAFARGQAAKATCAFKLRSIGTAIASYESVYGILPPAYVGYFHQRTFAGWNSYSWAVRILPYFEAEEVFHAVNFSVEPPSQLSFAIVNANVSVSTHRIAGFLCPADPVRRPKNRMNYRANYGRGVWDLGGESHTYSDMQAPFTNHIPCKRTQDLIDGSSHTVFVSERIVGDGDVLFYSKFGDVLAFDPTANLPKNPKEFADSCAAFDQSSSYAKLSAYSQSGHSWLLGDLYYVGFNTVMPPNAAVPDCGNPPGLGSPVAMSARSSHPNGVQAVFGDGSVTFLQNSIDIHVWRSMSTTSLGDD